MPNACECHGVMHFMMSDKLGCRNKGIRGSTSGLPKTMFGASTNKMPRYQFNNNDTTAPKRSCMGPPLELPRNPKRRIISSSSSNKVESSWSGPGTRPKVLASDSAVENSHEFNTPKNRPNVLRYISSSSRGGHSGRSGRSTSTSAVEASVILAIAEGRGMARGEIGMAAVDLKHPKLVLCQFSDTLLYTHALTKINYFNPVEIIVPHTFCEGTVPSQLYQLIRDQYPLINLTTVQRRHFSDAAGKQQIQTLCAPQYSAVYLQVLPKFYAVTAAAAVLKYVEYIQCVVFARESLKIEYHSSENTMIIDVGTATQLELVQPLVPSAGPSCSLLGVLGPTYTIGGLRTLRAAILQPSCNKDEIENRLDAVQDIIENDLGLMADLQDVIKKLSDVDKILFLCVETPNQNNDKFGEAQLNQTILLKTTIDIVPKLVEALTNATSGRLRKIKMEFENPQYKEIADRIHTIIQEDAHVEKGAMGYMQRCFAVKPEINGLLDVARRTYSELIDDIQKMVENLSESYDLPLRLNQNVMKGFHIVLPIGPKNRRNFCEEDLPPIFIQVYNSGTSVSMTTEDLVVLDQQAKEALNEIQRMSKIVISSLLQELRPFMASLYKLCENVSELDILLALAQASTVGSYVRPHFDNYMVVRNSVHPLLDYNSQVLPVPNDIFASPEHNFTIITGPNMGGKSIFIKQIAIIQVMAQLGCFLPTTNAIIRISDRIFSRIGFNDSVELNASTYVLEMKEVQHILKGLTRQSLVIIDELCRGTSSEEGTSMAWAICEELLKSDAFTFFTTHFMYLTRLQDLYFNVVNYHTAIKEEEITNGEVVQKRLIYEHRIVPGITKVEHYGLSLASKTNLAEETVNLAEELAEIIIKTRKSQDFNFSRESDDYLLYELNAKFQGERRIHNNELNSAKILQDFKNDNPSVIARLKNQENKPKDVNTSNIISNSSRENYGFNVRLRMEELQTAANSLNQFSLNNNEKYLTDCNSVDTEDVNISFAQHHLNTVKCSNELLTCMLYKNKIVNNVEDTELNDSRDKENDAFDFNSVLPVIEINTTAAENLTETNVPKNSNTCEVSKIISVIENVSNNETNADTETISSDSDIAEALTQIIEDFSTELIETDDEGLIRETVDEIDKDIENGRGNIENIILTPPLQFQD
ncbi:unnamed protein product [Chilo suppressalis]|uniref:DNA mismatch repair proteins mutS family domain-containing protein n=1 Tax=Chilo suppressalis TaxID=168631 RepID=A0ABN8ARE2_CHISP|nr:unnamed protein product [Chilo suppressalis]